MTQQLMALIDKAVKQGCSQAIRSKGHKPWTG